MVLFPKLILKAIDQLDHMTMISAAIFSKII